MEFTASFQEDFFNNLSLNTQDNEGEKDPGTLCTLFLGDLSVYCTEKDIRKLFRPFGTIEAIRVKRGSSNKTNLSYGFLKFSTRESADQALRALNGVMFLGRALRQVCVFLLLSFCYFKCS